MSLTTTVALSCDAPGCHMRFVATTVVPERVLMLAQEEGWTRVLTYARPPSGTEPRVQDFCLADRPLLVEPE